MTSRFWSAGANGLYGGFSRAAPGGGDPYGPELVLNGDFDDATDWTVNRCAIANNQLELINSSGFSGLARYTFPSGNLEAADYIVEWDQIDLTNVAGASHTLTIGGSAHSIPNADITSVGLARFSKTVTVAGTTATVQINCPNADNWIIDNFSVRKVL